MTVHREQSVKREKKTNKMHQLDVYYQLLSQHVSGIIIPIFRRTKTMLLHLVYCSGSEQYTKCSNTVFVLLKMGIMMPEKC